jgi:hypothetical protein
MAMAVAARGPLSTIATRLRADTSSFFLQPQQPLQVPRRLQLPSLVCSYGRRSILSSVAITPSSRDAGGVLDAAARVELAFVVGASVIPHPDKVYNLLNFYSSSGIITVFGLTSHSFCQKLWFLLLLVV